MYDAIIVGAGPTGCFAARELAGMGYSVLVLEEHAQIGEPVHCTGIISVEACRRFDLDLDCVEAYLSSARFFSPNGQSFRVSSDKAQAVVVDRSRFDRGLAQEALTAGSSFLLGARVQELDVTDDAVIARATSFGENLVFQSSLVIVATGADNSLVHHLRLGNAPTRWVLGAQLFAQSSDLDEVEVHLGQATAPGGFAWAVPANGSGCRVGLVSYNRPAPLLKKFAHMLNRRGAICWSGEPIRSRPIPEGPRTPSFGDRIMVVGDAAGQVKSTTSGGIYYGLLGAEAAVAVADRSLRTGNCTAEKLSRYEEEWTARLGPEQRTGRILRDIHRNLSDRDIENLFWLVRRMGIPRLLSKLRFDWHTSGLISILFQDMFGMTTRGLGKIAMKHVG